MYKNLRIYRLQDFDLSGAEIADQLANNKAGTPSGLQKSKTGWASPFGIHNKELTHTVMGFHRISLVTTQRILPKAAIDCVVDDRVFSFIEREKREPSTAEVKDIRKYAEDEMIPKAFIKRDCLNGIIDIPSGFLYVLTTSEKKADDFTAELRNALGSLKAFPLKTQNAAQIELTCWLKDAELPEYVSPGEKCTLVDTIADSNEKIPEIKFNHSDAGNRDVSRLLLEGMQIKDLSIIWADKLYLTIHGDLSISGIKPTDLSINALDKEASAENLRAHQDATLLLYGEYFRSLATDIISWFGGEVDYAKLAQDQFGIKEEIVNSTEPELNTLDDPEAGFVAKAGTEEVQEDFFADNSDDIQEPPADVA